MTKNLFLASCAKAAFTIATVMMMSAAFTACSSSNNDDDGGGGTPPPPEPKAQTVTLDGEEKPILKAEYKDKADGNYILYFYLSDDHKEKVIMQLNKDLHMSGNPIDLTKREEEHSGKWYWSVEYYKPDDTKLIDTYGRPGYSIPVFKTGTLTISGSPDGTINIKLENGRVEGLDGKEHTLAIGYSGRMMIMMEYVNLGLPSGIMWAKCNLGASKPSDYGNYYAWGEIEPNKANYSWATYKWMQPGQSDQKYITKYTFDDGKTEGIWYDSDGNFIGDNKKTLEAADDAASANLGLPWRMPTTDEIKELIDNCTWTWTTQDGKNGYEVKGPNGNSIFLPTTGYYLGSDLIYAGSWGYYWSSSLSTAGSYYARSLTFGSDGRSWGYSIRYCGFTVRPVRP